MIKILIVDDEPDIEHLFNQQFRKKIRNKEWSFIFAQNGKKALEVLQSHLDIDMVLSDINMPEMDGLTLLDEIKNNSHINAKTVIISAYGDMKNIRTAMNRGAFDFITKPIDFEDVSSTIEKTFQHIQILKQALENQNQLISLHKELETAKVIQESILPLSHPSSQYQIFTKIIPAKEVGGDFYDFFLIDKDHLCLLIADVSGKGVSSAIFAVVNQTLLKSKGSMALSPKECVQSVNQICSNNNENCMFVTLFYGVFNLKTGLFQYTNAGHLAPYHIHSDGKIELLHSLCDVPLGVQKNVEYKDQAVQIKKNDTLFLYTDGLTEARNTKKEIFGNKRLLEVLSKNSRQPIEELGKNILNSVQSFSGEAEQFDDITYLLFQYKNH